MSPLRNRCTRSVFAVLLVVAAAVLASAPHANAEVLSFRFTNRVSTPVWVKLFSNDRLKDWPDDGRLFILSDRSPRKYSVDCELGERICYGAWIEGDFSRFWGAGHEGKHDCDDCCEICEISAETPLHQVIFQ